jgi:biopolymer transport protein ExbD
MRTQTMPICDINTTPLVDVMLVLLIIFMITAPALNHRIDVKLPLVGPDDGKAPPKLLTLDIRADGSLALAGNAITLMDLSAAAKRAAGTKNADQFNLRTDPNAPYQRVAQVMAVLTKNSATPFRFDELAGR